MRQAHPLKVWLVRQSRTVKSLADELEIHASLLPQWMRGDRVIPAPMAERIAALTGGKVRVTSWPTTKRKSPAKA